MTARSRILFASRAVESPPQEGGFVLLRDIASTFENNDAIQPVMLSCTKIPYTNIAVEKVFSKTGWDRLARFQFLIGLARKAHKYPVVHTAHIPTKSNVRMLQYATKRAQRSGTKFVQTITGLPKVTDSELSRLIWGDYVVCQSPSAHKRISSLAGVPAACIVPWPSPDRVRRDEVRRAATRKRYAHDDGLLVVFPGEFERMGIGTDFSECIEALVALHPTIRIVLACRFDTLGIGDALQVLHPNNVLSVGKTNEMIELTEAADLVIFPTKKMDSKFHPPLIITEALSLGVPIVVSDKIDIAASTSPLIYKAKASATWQEFATTMNHAIQDTTGKNVAINGFEHMIKSYRAIYDTLLKEMS